jgi:leader peptidase (prepilin peptidase)/N-methyltransferase
MVASVFGAVIGIGLLALKVMQKGQYIPFGPYLALGALIAMIWGSDIWQWYFRGLV